MTNNKHATQADLIKVGAVLTAAPRWVIALLGAEGFPLPASWLPWWTPVSAALNVAMAIVEGLAFAYVFGIWSASRDKRSKWLVLVSLLAALFFIVVLTPSIAARVRGVEIGAVLENDWALMLWSMSVAASTITIVMSVGYAQRISAEVEIDPAPGRAPTITVSRPAGESPVLEGAETKHLLEGPVAWGNRRKATITDWRQILVAGELAGAELDAAAVRAELERRGFDAPSDSTIRAWAGMARESADA
jgi:hypothetical protein